MSGGAAGGSQAREMRRLLRGPSVAPAAVTRTSAQFRIAFYMPLIDQIKQLCDRLAPLGWRDFRLGSDARASLVGPEGKALMTRYEHIIEILDNAIGGPRENIGLQGAFWRGRTRDESCGSAAGLWVAGARRRRLRRLKSDQRLSLCRQPIPRMPFGFLPVPDSEIRFI